MPLLNQGKLDQKKQEFQVHPFALNYLPGQAVTVFRQVHDTAGRDCRPGQMEDMIATLQVL